MKIFNIFFWFSPLLISCKKNKVYNCSSITKNTSKVRSLLDAVDIDFTYCWKPSGRYGGIQKRSGKWESFSCPYIDLEIIECAFDYRDKNGVEFTTAVTKLKENVLQNYCNSVFIKNLSKMLSRLTRLMSLCEVKEAKQTLAPIQQRRAEMIDGSFKFNEQRIFASPLARSDSFERILPRMKSENITCFTCDARNQVDCKTSGHLETCAFDEVCMIEIRKRNGKTKQVLKGCKQTNACDVQIVNNFDLINTANSQCRPSLLAKGPSVCRQCCDSNGCNTEFDPVTVAEWVDGPIDQ